MTAGGVSGKVLDGVRRPGCSTTEAGRCRLTLLPRGSALACANTRRGRSRLLLSGRSRLQLDSDARVTLWTSHDPALPPLVSPGSPGSQLGFLGVTPQSAEE